MLVEEDDVQVHERMREQCSVIGSDHYPWVNSALWWNIAYKAGH